MARDCLLVDYSETILWFGKCRAMLSTRRPGLGVAWDPVFHCLSLSHSTHGARRGWTALDRKTLMSDRQTRLPACNINNILILCLLIVHDLVLFFLFSLIFWRSTKWPLEIRKRLFDKNGPQVARRSMILMPRCDCPVALWLTGRSFHSWPVAPQQVSRRPMIRLPADGWAFLRMSGWVEPSICTSLLNPLLPLVEPSLGGKTCLNTFFLVH